MIFVQIAAYKDPELIPTIKDCLENSKYKNDLRFGICWQTDDTDSSLDVFRNHSQFRIDKVRWQESKGLCWARSRIQSMYSGERYTLQIDSHHRFVKNWDELLLQYLESTSSSKPILTTYGCTYNPESNQRTSNEPYKMVADKFTDSGTILFRPHTIPGWRDLNSPIPARFVSGHFFFTLGNHCEEYKYDPNLYFAGDEISLSIRSFTLGYDLYHPHRPVIWHEYTRKDRVKHWDDHNSKHKDQVELMWHQRDVVSKRRLRKLLQEEDNDEDISGFGLGTARTHRDYEIYCGIDFSTRRLNREAKLGIDPPCSYQDEDQWERSFQRSEKSHLVKWNISDIEPSEDYKFIYFGVEDSSGNVIYRYDALPSSIEAKLQTDSKEITLTEDVVPHKLVVWPVCRNRGWLKKMEYNLNS